MSHMIALHPGQEQTKSHSEDKSHPNNSQQLSLKLSKMKTQNRDL